MDFIDSIKKTKEDSFILASLPEEIRNDALERMTKALQANKEAIFRGECTGSGACEGSWSASSNCEPSCV